MDALALDPVLARACGAALAVILLLGAWQKLRDVAVFEASVELYRLLPEALVPAFARVFPVLEAIAGTALLFDGTRAAGLAVGALVLGAATLAVAINVARGRTGIDCGCGGAEGHTRLSWALVVRNAVLLALLGAGAQAGAERSLVWIDYLSVAGGTLMLLALHAAANQLLANHPHLAQMRNGS
ncbi:MauE/DoxX family redox-associated membrane protein [Thauera sinica]|uniref:Methylamine utilization protein MauE n=1 Tax=Thauera sinica TaxID=2665146 RepID=A0ABW1AYP1_9RHOO|nr:MauE/DoxX family redox-associated membrane protein [Thauera sp. K11]ATE58620.1 methylamine utilization protein MauE [Thauera sp. K11]